MATQLQAPDEVEEARRLFTEAFRELLLPVAQSPEKAEAMGKRLADMRKHATERHDYYERYRNQYLAVGLSMLPLSFAIASFILNFVNAAKVALPWASLAGLGVLAFIGTGLTVLFSYIRQTSANYCYRGVARTPSWYHAYVGLAGAGDSDRLCPQQRKADQTDWAKALGRFGQDWIAAMASPWRPLAEDIEQVFILFVLQSVKRGQVRHLATVVKWGAVAGALLLFAGLVLLGFGIGTAPQP